MKIRWKPIILGIGLLTIASLVVFLASRGPDPDEVPTAQSVWSRVMSPYCEGLTLEECPSGSSVELRREIAVKVAQGWTNSELDAWLVDNFGEAIFGRPSSALAWIVPMALFLVGSAVVWILSRTMIARQKTTPNAAKESDLERVRADLRSFMEGTNE